MFPRLASLLILCSLGAAGLSAQGLNTTATKDDWEEVNFETGSAVLSDGYPSLLRLAELLSKNASYRVKVDGHTDSVGSDRSNDKLAMARANTVKSFLEKYGANPSQIEVMGKGKKQPKVENSTKEGRFMNRRVSLNVVDGDGKSISAGSVGDAIRNLNAAQGGPAGAADPKCCDEILKRLDKLDDILALLKDVKSENARLRSDVDALKSAQIGIKNSQTDVAKRVEEASNKAVTLPQIDEVAKSAAQNAIEASRNRKFSILGVNAGVDGEKHLTFTGKGRYFDPINKSFAIQSEGEFMYFRDRKEAQFDLGIVQRYKRFQAGLFGSFKHVDIREFQDGGNLGQASVTFDYLFKFGRVGLFGSKGFLDNSVVNNRFINRNIFEISYLKIVDQIGGSASIGLWKNAYAEGNLGYLKSRLGNDKPGGTIRIINPINRYIALTVEGGFNETMLTKDANGRVAVGLQFGNFLRPREFLATDHPVPVDIPRIRYEVLTKRVRTGNDAPVADAGPDQIGVTAGAMTLDGSASYDPDGDVITYQWTQIAGPTVSINGATNAKATFTAAESQSYAFRLTVKDTYGAQSIARVTYTTTAPQNVKILNFSATPSSITAGQTSVLIWEVVNADTVTIDAIGKVDSSHGTSSVAPTETTIYKITATNKTSSANATTTITVARPQVRILSFTAIPATILTGESSTLQWTTENADTVTLAGVGNVPVNGTAPVSPKETTTYTLMARNKYGDVTATTVVRLSVAPPNPSEGGQPPRIIRFNATPPDILSTEKSTINWQVENADVVTITGIGGVPLTGSQQVGPQATTTYTIVAKNKFGETSTNLVITVSQATTITSCIASPATINPGENSVLTYTALNATQVTVSGIGVVYGGILVRPNATTSYTITAVGARNQASCQVTVNVNQPPPPPTPVKTPTANAGQNFDTIYRINTLDASKSTDPDGLPLTYSWRIINQTAVILDVNSPTPRVQLGEQYGIYIFEVTVTNTKGISSKSQVTVNFIKTTVR
jgi:hypothetical protein